jgi:Na+-driven multidrug efflux pump
MAAYAVTLASVLNIFFDWLFIGYLELGIKGAAMATVLSHVFGFLMLLSHFFRKDARLKLLWKNDGWGELLQAAYNGFSEFINEMSAGIVVLLFNLIMIRKMGVSGVAAFTIINYLIYAGLMISYGVSDSLQPIISKNFGAQNPGRISQFIKVAVAMLITNGFILVSLFICIPDTLVHFFISDEESETISIALRFMSLFWPAFLFSGMNIALSAYFTAMHKPLHSASVALFRSLILPAAFVLILPLLLGESGIFLAIPIAEVITFMLAVTLLYYNSPNQLVKAEYHSASDVV